MHDRRQLFLFCFIGWNCLAPLRAEGQREPVNLPGGSKLEKIDFERHVMALVGRLGCNSGACHGSFQGRGSFRLSLFGYDFDMDHQAITDLVDADDPDESYMLQKATLQIEHGGGERFPKNSWQHRVLREWIATGATRIAGSGAVKSLDLFPATVRFRRPEETQQMKVVATFSDGSREDVTPFCEFRVGDDHVLDVSEGGFLRSINPGDTPLVVQYRGEVRAAQILVPTPVEGNLVYPRVSQEIDKQVILKLRQLNVVPSDLATDMEFLRRVTIDTIGTLPSPEEVRRFVADTNPHKRRKKIRELLDNPLHAALWATKLSDITGNDTSTLGRNGEKRSRMWHDWLRQRFEKNVPWDEIVAGVLTASSREGREAQEWVTAARAIDEAAVNSFETDYPGRATLDLFWQRNGIAKNALAEGVAAAFLGVRLQCAQCHKHPYDRWTQRDYRSFVNVFGQVRTGASPEAKPLIDAENRRRGNRLPQLREVFTVFDSPELMRDPKTSQPLPARTLGGDKLPAGEDWRAALVDWMRDSNNTYFAQAFVNRVWGHYFGRGIVEPVDDFSIGNPPSNPQLLDLLAREFIKHRYDVRYIEELILNSRTYQQSSFPNETNLDDRRNFARSYPRRMMAETVVDVINAALGVDASFPSDAPEGSHAIEVAATSIRDANLRRAFQVFGRPNRKSACDCDRSNAPSLSQTLFMMTDDQILQRIRGGRLSGLLEGDRRRQLRTGAIARQEVEEILDELSLAILTRPMTPGERLSSVQHVFRAGKGEKALADIVWAMLNSREFLLIH